MTDELILVDSRNRAIGQADKRSVHAAGLRHRAFSIFLVDRNGRLLLQQRQLTKYHSGGLWANSCCGHPHVGERTLSAAQRRLREELGVVTPLRFRFFSSYHTAFSNGLQENEIVHVYFGLLPDSVQPNPREIMAVSTRSLAELENDIAAHPDRHAFWLKHYLSHHRDALALALREITSTRDVSPLRRQRRSLSRTDVR